MCIKKANTIHLAYGTVLGVSIILAGICLIAACLGIYDSGNGTFSREAVAAAFSPIRVPVYLCLGLTVLGIPLAMLTRTEKKKTPAGKREDLILKRLHRKTDLSQCDPALRAAVEAEQNRRKKLSNGLKWLLVFCTVSGLTHLLSKDRFQLPDITASMISAMGILAFWVGIPFVFSLFVIYGTRRSIRRETELMRRANAEAPRTAEKVTAVVEKENLNTLRAAIIVLAVAIVLFGYFTGGTVDVLTKAVNICTECVGLG